jgi:lipopolysaccharide transport system ATP-binding protein
MSEGNFFIGAAVGTHSPSVAVHAHAGDNAVGFRVIDFGEGDTARGDYGGHLPGVIRPNWKWETNYISQNGSSFSTVSIPESTDKKTK